MNSQTTSIFLCLSFFMLIIQKIGMLNSYSLVFVMLSATFLCLGCIRIFDKNVTISKDILLFLFFINGILFVHCIYTIAIQNFHSTLASLKVIIYTTLVILCVSVSSPKYTIGNVVKYMGIISVVSSIYGILLLILGDATFIGKHRVLMFNGFYQFADGTYPFYRISGLFDNANSAAILALFGLIALDRVGDKTKKISFLVLINVFFIFLIGSRTVLILLLIYFLVTKINKLKLKNVLTFFVVFIPIVLLIIQKFYSLDVDLNSYLESRMNDGLSSRDIAWGYLYEWFVNNPNGIGLDYADYRLLEEINLGFGSHSGHFALITEVGIVLYSLLMIAILFMAIKNFFNRAVIDSLYIVYTPLIILIHQFIERGIFQITYHYFLLLMVLVLGILKGRENEYTRNNVS